MKATDAGSSERTVWRAGRGQMLAPGLGAVAMLFTGTSAVLGLVDGSHSVGRLVVLVVSATVFVAQLTLVVLTFRRLRVRLTELGVEVKPALGQTKLYPYADIVEVQPDRLTGYREIRVSLVMRDRARIVLPAPTEPRDRTDPGFEAAVQSIVRRCDAARARQQDRAG